MDMDRSDDDDDDEVLYGTGTPFLYLKQYTIKKNKVNQFHSIDISRQVIQAPLRLFGL